MKKILIPTDFSKNSKNAIRYALALFQETSCHFFLLYINVEGSDVREKTIYELGTNIMVKKEAKSISQKLKDLEQFVTSISSKKEYHQVTIIREEGYFLKNIRKHIQEKEIELIVMGTRGASELKEFFMGTRSGDVITKVESDVLVVPDNAEFKGFMNVVFSVDFEINYDDKTLKKIADIIPSKMAQIKMLYVTKSEIKLMNKVALQQKKLVQRLSQILPNPISLERVVSRKVEDGVQVFAESSNADLIIMISKDYGLLQELFLDTTVEEVSFNTRIPLLSLQG
ncbi:MAG: nucleotide-binding universal stress UspA family protein [Maribacter sp.]|jgi:nucleotide-binding universal stress UspA family protein